ncbi:Thiol:disulfide interchange protein DsbD [Pseudidiomarina planktonica]|uniref:Thiol:disulfide interchange protein DsbD n=1 Tax=Pseudidiomarina planktonica TaxID=1323738 RepID=A0A1Y6G2N5_9GAMM|nr:protein-disulfide reductase DsbD [Pseudidiomarina planktonica]RUO63811.1 protein-disulfide reductase DsbD [Pseudidiomarina planktonica]SMQ80124.1 Thiol:disulfide interchange protein DsbD [Pseudidiomarina planktonica]
MTTAVPVRWFAICLVVLLGGFSWPATALQTDFLNQQDQQEQRFLPVDQAFEFDFRQRGQELEISWDIEPGYYLYQHRFQFEPASILAETVTFPEGEAHSDEFFGESIIYRDEVRLTVQLGDVAADQPLTVGYQGCADAGLCYPPTEKVIYLQAAGNPANAANAASSRVEQVAAGSQSASGFAGQLSEQPLPLALLAFFILGIGLAFTPCVLPMYPIISSIILGQQRANNNQLSTGRALSLSLSYVLGMAVTYTGLGILVALAGMRYQAALQHPVILSIIAVLFVVLALSLLGLYNLQMPAGLQQRINQLSNKQRGGAFTSVFIMGALSGLVVSPCTTAPLSGILLFVAQSGDAMIGATALFSLSLGMGVPLLAVGTSGGKLLPKAGAWMESVKRFFGILLIGVTIIMIERLLPLVVGQWLWVIFFSLSGIYMLHQVLGHARGWRATLVATLIAVASGSGILWQLPSTSASANHLAFTQVSNLSELNQQLELARERQQPVMLDLYADWCVACKEFERYTFSDQQVQQQLNNFVVLQADVTANNEANNALLEQYQVFGLPTILFFDSTASELPGQRVTGFMNADDFLEHLQRVDSTQQ